MTLRLKGASKNCAGDESLLTESGERGIAGLTPSISLRITVWFSTVYLLGLLAFGLIMRFDLSSSLESGRERTLSTRAERLLHLVTRMKNASAHDRREEFREFAEGTPEGDLILAEDESGRQTFPVPPLAPRQFPWPRSAQVKGQFVRVTSQGKSYLVLVAPARVDTGQLKIYIGGQLEDNRWLLDRFSLGLMATVPALFLLSALGGYFLSRRALNPIQRLTNTVRNISIHNLSQRVPIAGTRDELERLAETCNDMLQRLESAVARTVQFTADASHELRNPISYIRTIAECALLSTDLTEECRNGFKDIVTECEHTALLLEDMLSLARADAGEGMLDAEPLDLALIVRETVERAEPLATRKGQHLIWRNQLSAPALVIGNASNIKRLCWIFTDNAIKYTPDGGLIALQLDLEGGRPTLTITDSGQGIAPEALPRIFERFFRADASRGEIAGVGLGLSIAKWIADVHGASIEVASAEGRGSTFKILFPAVPVLASQFASY